MALIVEAAGALRLDVAAALLAFETALFRAKRRLGRTPDDRPNHGLAQQFQQAIDRVGAVALLGAETLRVDYDHAVLGHALAGQPVEPHLRIGWQRDPLCIEPQLRRRRELVDVLSARSGGAHKADLDI